MVTEIEVAQAERDIDLSGAGDLLSMQHLLGIPSVKYVWERVLNDAAPNFHVIGTLLLKTMETLERDMPTLDMFIEQSQQLGQTPLVESWQESKTLAEAFLSRLKVITIEGMKGQAYHALEIWKARQCEDAIKQMQKVFTSKEKARILRLCSTLQAPYPGAPRHAYKITPMGYTVLGEPDWQLDLNRQGERWIAVARRGKRVASWPFTDVEAIEREIKAWGD